MAESEVPITDRQQTHDGKSVETLEEREFDELLRAAANERRRAIVRELGAEEGPITLSDLAGRLVGFDGAASDSPLGHPDVEQLTIDLYHVHLPLLADAKVVQFDEDRQTIAKDDTFKRLAQLLGPELE